MSPFEAPASLVEVPELMESASLKSKDLNSKQVEILGEPRKLTVKGKKMTHTDGDKLREYLYFEPEEIEQVDVNKIKTLTS
jgi:hypothetical protein